MKNAPQNPQKERVIDIKTLCTDDLTALRSQIDRELAARANTAPLVATQLNFNAGNRRAGAKCWVKIPSGVDTTKPNGWGIIGSFANEINPDKTDTHYFDVRGSEGTLIVASGAGGSYRNSTTIHVVLRIKIGAKLEFSSGYQRLSGDNLEFIECKKDRTEILNTYPDLKDMKPEWLEVFALLMSLGISREGSEQSNLAP